MRDRYADAVEWVDQALNLPGADAHRALRVNALRVKIIGLWFLGRRSELPALLAEAEAIARELRDPALLSQVLQDRADHEAALRFDLAARLAEEALSSAWATGDQWLIAQALRSHAKLAPTVEELRTRVEWAASRLKEAGNLFELAGLLGVAGYVALRERSDRDAKDLTESALAVACELDHPATLMFAQGNFGLAALLSGETDVAGDAFREELALCRDLVVRPFVSEGLLGLGAVAAVRGDADRAARLAGAAAAHRCEPDDALQARLRETFFEPLRTRRGSDAWDAAALAGEALDFDAAIAYALQEMG